MKRKDTGPKTASDAKNKKSKWSVPDSLLVDSPVEDRLALLTGCVGNACIGCQEMFGPHSLATPGRPVILALSNGKFNFNPIDMPGFAPKLVYCAFCTLALTTEKRNRNLSCPGNKYTKLMAPCGQYDAHSMVSRIGDDFDHYRWWFIVVIP